MGDIGGLTCRVSKYTHIGANPNCSGHRTSGETDITKITLKLNTPNTRFVLVQADYDSSHFGGIHVPWQAWTLDVASWREIENAIFNSISDWDLATSDGVQRP